MSKRVKPVLEGPVLKNLEDADAVLAEIAGFKRSVALAELGAQ